MNDKKKVLLIHPRADKPGLAGLAPALRAAGAEVEEFFLRGDYPALLDALEGEVLPMVIKPASVK
ncbi:MAG TPA: hypothetical protein PKH69_07820 [Thiobacillaceae bacterium]|nr:hypothetical protein [Thiobacillaceae bacterium]HNU63993.1 hypothetical protein [Thiobacillaceae bacterium]